MEPLQTNYSDKHAQAGPIISLSYKSEHIEGMNIILNLAETEPRVL
jgi:hypothetical protein